MVDEPQKPQPKFTPTGKPRRTRKYRPKPQPRDRSSDIDRPERFEVKVLSNQYPDPLTGKTHQPFTPERQDRWFTELARTASILVACRLVGIHPSTISNHRQESPEFDDRFEEALQIHRDSIESEIHRRAVIGIEEPIFFKGEQKDFKTVFSDQLLLEYARRHIPAYRPRSETLNLNATLDMGRASDISNLTLEQRDRLRDLLDTAKHQALPVHEVKLTELVDDEPSDDTPEDDHAL